MKVFALKTLLSFSLMIIFHYTTMAQEKTIIQIEKLTKPTALLKQIDSKTIYNQFKLGLVKSSAMPDSLVAFGEHPFLNGLVNAYQNHRPFTFSPDMFWILITQGFARNVTNHSEELREKLVGFDGKKELNVDANKYNIMLNKSSADWERVFPIFNRQIEKYSGKSLNKTLTSNFTTTTSVSKVVSQLTIMEAFKSYFDYKVSYVGCGLPYVNLEGSLGDWRKLKTKTKQLSKYKLAWWTKELIPILDKLIEAKKGKVDTAFWKNTVKIRTEKEAYGPFDHINGWITKFFPFNDKGQQLSLKEIFTASSLASEIVKVPFVLEDKDSGKNYSMEFWGGFVGCEQNTSDFSLKPILGWAINNAPIQNLGNPSHYQKGNTLELKNIDEIPKSVLEQQYFKSLALSFRYKIIIPTQLAKVKIDKLFLFGVISEVEKQKIIAMFPETEIEFNRVEPLNWSFLDFLEDSINFVGSWYTKLQYLNIKILIV